MLHTVFGKQSLVSPSIGPGLTLYRDLTRISLQETLETVYPLTRRSYMEVLGEEAWQTLAKDYVTQNWPRDFRINWTVFSFPIWLSDQLSHSLSGCLVTQDWFAELADYEWARFESLSFRDPDPSEWLNPSLLLRSYQYSVPQLFMNDENSSWADQIQINCQKKGPTHTALFRNSHTGLLQVLEMQPAAFEILCRWKDGETPDDSVHQLAQQLEHSPHLIRQKMEPLIKMFTVQGILITRESKKKLETLSHKS